MILSVSRRTDIPNYYSEWFYNRIKEGFVYVRNPMNAHQISRIDLSPEVVDCIVFWTKNPAPMLARLHELEAYHYYFQFTLTGYGKDIEENIPHKKEKMLPIFQNLSGKVGAERVVWRYDPILFTKVYTPEYHLQAFEQIAKALRGYTKQCVISFVDAYAKNKKQLEKKKVYALETDELLAFAGQLSQIAKANEMVISSCAESMDLSDCGIAHGSCIDKSLIERITGYPIKAAKDKNQRQTCGCVESIDIGAYNTCPNHCCYCYANYKEAVVQKNCRQYEAKSPILCDKIREEDEIYIRKAVSLRVEKNGQMSLFS